MQNDGEGRLSADPSEGGLAPKPSEPRCPSCRTACGLSAQGACVCVRCGLVIPLEHAVEEPSLGQVLAGLKLRAPLRAPADEVRRYVATDDEERRFEVVIGPKESPAFDQRQRARAELGPLTTAPTRIELLESGRLMEVVPFSDLPTLSAGLSTLLAHKDSGEPVALIRRWLWPVLTLVAHHHHQGHFFGGLDPAELLVGEDGQVLFRAPPVYLKCQERAGERRPVVVGFSAPEVFGRCGGLLGPQTDVFFLGACLYYILTRTAPLAEASFALERLPAPVVYRESVPPELAAVARRATSPVPARRYSSAVELSSALEQALTIVSARAQGHPGRLYLDVGHELHVGVLKGQYTPKNQDDLFIGWLPEARLGLFLISDGVSISTYGSGDQASRCVREEAALTWQTIIEGHPGERADELEETLEGGGVRPHLPQTFSGRRALLEGLLEGANRGIARTVQGIIPRFAGPPEGIMAATAVMVLMDGNRVTLAGIGDSRIYLVRDGHIITLLADHDLCSQLIRMGRAPAAARAVPAAAALVRCVGEFDLGPDGQLLPVPLAPECMELSLLPGDALVLCSDGIPDYTGFDEEDSEERIRALVESAPTAAWAAFELMVAANRGGGGDNISCIVLRFFDEEER